MRCQPICCPPPPTSAMCRPLLILTNGYDGTVTDMYFALGRRRHAARLSLASLRRARPRRNALQAGRPLRPDWETCGAGGRRISRWRSRSSTPRIALNGWSLGGHLALRAASGEPRIAAVIADPGLWSIAGVLPPLRRQARRLAGGRSQPRRASRRHACWTAWTRRARGPEAAVDLCAARLLGARDWRPAQLPADGGAFTMDGRAETDPLPDPANVGRARSPPPPRRQVLDALRCPKTLLQFTAAEGAVVTARCRTAPCSTGVHWIGSTSSSRSERSLLRIASRGAAAHDRRDHARMR